MAPQIQAPEESDVLREQLEYLIAHAACNPQCGCSECRRYRKVRSVLLEIFAEPPRAMVREMAPSFARAA
jgi:hypothetical protein